MLKRGAGVIPFAVVGGDTFFLFQSVLSGRKAGYLIDFGGGLSEGEAARDCAAREFIEETETMYFSDDLSRARRTEESINRQMPFVASLFDATLSDHPDWWCRRAVGNPLKPKDWKTFFIEMPFRDPGMMNSAWLNDGLGRYKKRRELIWVPADELVSTYATHPERLWKRVRQLEGAPQLIGRIQQTKTPV